MANNNHNGSADFPANLISLFERLFFASRPITLLLFAGLTAIAIWGMSMIKLDSQFDKQLPQSHPYIKTFTFYGDALTPVDELTFAFARTDGGTVFEDSYLKQLAALAEKAKILPYVDPESVASLQDYAALLGGGDNLKQFVEREGLIGTLISDDLSASILTIRVYTNLNGEGAANLSYAIEQDLRPTFETTGRKLMVTGFAKRVGAIASYAQEVIQFIGISALMTFLFVIYFARSLWLGLLTIFCSSLAITWQIGLLSIIGVSFDPLGVLIPFLLFAIGISHGLQQVNRLSRSVCSGHSALDAGRASFRQLMIPGSMALLTDLIGFGTLYLVPIPLIQDIAVTAMLGIGFMILSNLVLLPVIGSYLPYSHAYRTRITKVRYRRERLLSRLGWVAEPRNAFIVTLVTLTVLTAGIMQSRNRHIGDDKHGAPELHESDRFNQDAAGIVSLFSAGTDTLTVAVELPHGQCATHKGLGRVEQFRLKMAQVPGVTRATGPTADIVKAYQAETGIATLPTDRRLLRNAILQTDHDDRLFEKGCRMVPVELTLVDHAEVTLNRVIDEVESYQRHQPMNAQAKSQIARQTLMFCHEHAILNSTMPGGTPIENFCAQERVVIFINEFGDRQGRSIDARPPHEPINTLCEWGETRSHLEPLINDIQQYCGNLDYARYRLAGGNAGIQAALNQEVERQEIRTVLIVYAVIILLVAFTYRDWRATICCTLPLTGATFSGYWFMSVADIGLSVATLPVMVLAVGVGVDYAFYIYNRLQHHLSRGNDVVDAYRQSIAETGSAVIATALTLSLGVVAWVFSGLQFQAEMGLLLCVMFLLNMIGAVTALPALAVVIDKLVPRRHAVRAPLSH